MKINEKIKRIRRLKGWSQEEMAEKLNMSIGGYANIERGKTNIRHKRLQDIAQAFHMKLSKLIDLEDENFQGFLGENDKTDNQVTVLSDTQLQHKLAKAELEIIYLKEENNHLKEMIELIKKK